MKKTVLVFSIALLSLVSVVHADPNFTAASLQSSDVTSGYYYTAAYGGVAKAANGISYLNVESRYAASYNCWAAVRFDLGTIKNAIDANLGAGNWHVQKVILSLWDTAPSFGVPGTIEVRFTYDDIVKLTASQGAGDPNSPLVMNLPPLYPINNQFTHDTHDSNGTFVEFIAYNKLPGFPEVQNVLFDNSGSNSQGATYIANHIRDANQLTLAFIDADSTVIAGWVGYGSAYATEHPKLTVTAVATGHVPNCINHPSMDLNGDCKVNFEDFAMFAGQWLHCGYEDPNDCK
jgi:hypothetical protein